MNGYLVLLCHSMDDFPVGLFLTRDEAEEFARTVDWDAWEDGPMGIDASTPVCTKIVQFFGGKPVSCEVVRLYEDEQPA